MTERQNNKKAERQKDIRKKDRMKDRIIKRPKDRKKERKKKDRKTKRQKDRKTEGQTIDVPLDNCAFLIQVRQKDLNRN